MYAQGADSAGLACSCCVGMQPARARAADKFVLHSASLRRTVPMTCLRAASLQKYACARLLEVALVLGIHTEHFLQCTPEKSALAMNARDALLTACHPKPPATADELTLIPTCLCCLLALLLADLFETMMMNTTTIDEMPSNGTKDDMMMNETTSDNATCVCVGERQEDAGPGTALQHLDLSKG